MPYQLNGQLVTRKSERLLHATGAVTAVGGGAFVAMSEAVASPNDVAMSNVETPAMLSEVRFILSSEGNSLYWRLQPFAVARRLKVTFASLFCELLRLGHNGLVSAPSQSFPYSCRPSSNWRSISG